MANQKDYEILMELKPLETLFTELGSVRARLYLEDLQGFSISTIRNAVSRVRKTWDRVSFPPPAVIVKECEAMEGIKAGGIKSSQGNLPWEIRERERNEKVQTYLGAYRMNSIWHEAEKGCYEHHLMKYVREVAQVQAQMLLLTPSGNIYLSWNIVYPSDIKPNELGLWQRNWLRDQHAACNSGSIDVAVPTGKIAEWIEQVRLDKFIAENEKEKMARKYGTSLSDAFPTQEITPPIPERSPTGCFEYDSMHNLEPLYDF